LVPRSVFNLEKLADTENSRYALGGVKFERGKPTSKGKDQKPGEPLAIATDGCKLAVLTWPEPNPDDYPTAGAGADFSAQPNPEFSAIVPAGACVEAARAVKKLGKRLLGSKPILGNVAIDESQAVSNGKPGRVPMFTTDLEAGRRVDPQVLDGRYPAWQQVCPNYTADNSVSVQLDAKFLRELLEVVEGHCYDSNIGRAAVTLTLGVDPGEKIETTGEDGRKHAAKRPLAARGWQSPVLLTAVTADGRKAAGVVMPVVKGKKDSESVSGPKGRADAKLWPMLPRWAPCQTEADPEPADEREPVAPQTPPATASKPPAADDTEPAEPPAACPWAPQSIDCLM